MWKQQVSAKPNEMQSFYMQPTDGFSFRELSHAQINVIEASEVSAQFMPMEQKNGILIEFLP